MAISKYTGNYTRAFLSTKVSPSDSIEQTFYSDSIKVDEGEGCYIYSFKENKLIFSKGMDSFFDVGFEEVNMLFLNNLIQEGFHDFTNEYHDRLLLYLYNHNENLEFFSSSIIIKVKDYDYPVLVNIKILKTDTNGNLVSIIGRIKAIRGLNSTNVVQYSLKGINDHKFTDTINFGLDYDLSISEPNIILIEQIEKGNSLEIISKNLEIPTEKIKNRIDELYRRFNVKTNEELVEFAKTNFLIPNQFKGIISKQI